MGEPATVIQLTVLDGGLKDLSGDLVILTYEQLEELLSTQFSLLNAKKDANTNALFNGEITPEQFFGLFKSIQKQLERLENQRYIEEFPLYLTLAQAIKLLNISKRKFQEYVENGVLPPPITPPNTNTLNGGEQKKNWLQNAKMGKKRITRLVEQLQI